MGIMLMVPDVILQTGRLGPVTANLAESWIKQFEFKVTYDTIGETDIQPVSEVLNYQAMDDFKKYLTERGIDEVLMAFIKEEFDSLTFFHVIYSHRFSKDISKIAFYCTTWIDDYFYINGDIIPEYARKELLNEYGIDIDNLDEDTDELSNTIMHEIEYFGISISKVLYVPLLLYLKQSTKRFKGNHFTKLWVYTAGIISCGHEFFDSRSSILDLITDSNINWVKDPTILQALAVVLCLYVYPGRIVINSDMVNLIIAATRGYINMGNKINLENIKNMASGILDIFPKFTSLNEEYKYDEIRKLMSNIDYSYFDPAKSILSNFVYDNITGLLNDFIIFYMNNNLTDTKEALEKLTIRMEPFCEVLDIANPGKILIDELNSRGYDGNTTASYILNGRTVWVNGGKIYPEYELDSYTSEQLPILSIDISI